MMIRGWCWRSRELGIVGVGLGLGLWLICWVLIGRFLGLFCGGWLFSYTQIIVI